MTELRENLGYVYAAGSAIEEHAAVDAVTVIGFETDTRTAGAGAAIRAARGELARIAGAAPPTDDEVAAARSYAVGITSPLLSGQRGLAHQLLTLATAGLDHDWLPGHLHRLRTVTPDAVRAAAARFLATERFTGVGAGDPAVLLPELEALGAPAPLG
ncbi:hypothetical protein [Kitasatospora sp. NPDC057223]|uniref:hypothetical protein n=1 Tax=Kitasatospora sp. NPDC057223 TaxID=3346055 RepID=UPI003642BC8B